MWRKRKELKQAELIPKDAIVEGTVSRDTAIQVRTNAILHHIPLFKCLMSFIFEQEQEVTGFGSRWAFSLD
jgi:hypothetical protein